LPVLLPARGEETRVRVIKERDGGIVRRVRLVGDDGEPVGPVCRFLDHLGDREFLPNKLAAYGYDLKYLFIFLDREGLDWQDFRAPHMLALLAFLRRVPSRRPAQRLGLAVVADGQDGPGRLLSPATVDRILAAVSSFYDWAILAEEYECGVSPVQMRADPALARVPERHQPYMGRASRQQPVHRVVQVKRPRRLPRPMNEPDLEALLSGLKRLQDPGDAAAHAGRRAPPGRGAVAAPSGHLLRPAPGDDPQTGTRKPAEIGNRQVRHQVVEFTQGRCRVDPVQALLEFVEGQPAGRVMFAQGGRGPAPILIGGANPRITGHCRPFRLTARWLRRRRPGRGIGPCHVLRKALAPEAASRSFSCPHALAFVQPCSGRCGCPAWPGEPSARRRRGRISVQEDAHARDRFCGAGISHGPQGFVARTLERVTHG
jgi:hypothetical protein